ncbi:Hypothetical protein R9X50_00456800 [Acrodontium crateriforme]|uniref:CBF1-interacting co-repressor CIR N-terminal domain-containing protein n=1 Tax=Acrodontium crateriforme TaxID=150365 RepID=A0AAQ3R562_9PEZI|nr:Hypothetical protein R9X50_00456800 [Acrodontium crateriforme]
MGGDLNLKKSWHPALMSNQKRVWEEEKKALDERKKIEQVIKERAEERQIQELERMHEAAGGKKRVDRVEWMYSGPGSGGPSGGAVTEEMEGYLLGKRRLDGLVKKAETQNLKKDSGQEGFMAENQHANTARDTANKVANDPMLAIKRQEQAAYEAMMSDPAKTKNDDTGHIDTGDEMIMTDEEATAEIMMVTTNTEASAEDTAMRMTTDDLVDTVLTETDDDRGRPPDLDQGHLRGDGVTMTGLTGDITQTEIETTTDLGQDLHYADVIVTKEPSGVAHIQALADLALLTLVLDPFTIHNGKKRITLIEGHHTHSKSKADEDAERAAKLAAMQSNASELESDRQQRLAEIAAQEAKQKEEDDAKRSDQAKFVGSVRRTAEGVDLGRRLQGRGRGGNDD